MYNALSHYPFSLIDTISSVIVEETEVPIDIKHPIILKCADKFSDTDLPRVGFKSRQ